MVLQKTKQEFIELKIKNFNLIKIPKKEDDIVETSVFYKTGEIKISLEDYYERVVKYLGLEEFHEIYAIIYINRLLKKNNFLKERICWHKIFFIAFVMAQKFLEDDTFSANCYSKIGGIKRSIFDAMELEFLHRMDFNLFVDEATIKEFSCLHL